MNALRSRDTTQDFVDTIPTEARCRQDEIHDAAVMKAFRIGLSEGRELGFTEGFNYANLRRSV